MRTVLISVEGFVLWAACLGIARLLAASSASSMTTATLTFVAIWFVAAANSKNMGSGLARMQGTHEG